LAATPVVGVQLFGNLTELPFAAALLGLVTALAAGPRPAAWWMAAGCALLALSIRYVGVIAYAVLWAWWGVQACRPGAGRRLGAATIAVVSSTLAATGLLLWNLHATGSLSGALRDAPDHLGIAAWPQHAADLGWSPAAALMLGELRGLAGGNALGGRLLGMLFSLTGATVCLWAWLRPRFPWVRPFALLAFAYGAGMTVLRSAGNFDSLYGARVFLPILFPLGIVAIAQSSGRWPRLAVVACTGLLVAGFVSAARGLSREIAGDIREAVPLLRARLNAGDGVQINDQAFSLAAYLPQRTRRAWSESWSEKEAERFLVVAAKPVDRRGTPGPLSPAWRAFAAEMVAQGRYRRLRDSSSLLVLERLAEISPR
jgi:hypothetical protein